MVDIDIPYAEETADTRTTCEKYPDLPECQTGGDGGGGGSAAPTISAINAASLGGNNIRITIVGTNFRSGATATVSSGSSSRASTNNDVASSTQFKCDFDMSNLESGAYTFTFMNIDGTSATAAINWTAAPSGGGTGTGGGETVGGTGTGSTGGTGTGGAVEYITPTPASPPPDWTPSEGCAIAAEDVELTDGFIIPKGSTICNDGSVLLTDGTWLPAGTATASHVKSGNVPAAGGGGVNLLVIGAVVIGLGAIGYYLYSKRSEQGDQ